MTTKIKCLFFLSFLFLSCEKKTTNDYKTLILGDWIFERENPKRENYFYSDFGYTFQENGVCISKPGYYHETKRTEKEESKTFFHGNKTKYKIEGDSLYILNLITKKWDASKIAKIDSKFLKLSNEKDITLELSKVEYSENEDENFDKIIISTSPCFGSCAMLDIEIDKNGTVYYYGQHYNLIDGFFKAKITPNEFNEIVNDFKKTNFLDLKDAYRANWTDDQGISVTFVKDNKIIKTISDYGRQSPKLFRITLEPIMYLYQQVKLQPIENERKFQNDYYYYFSKGKGSMRLNNSELFYFSNLLSTSQKTNQSFKPKYKIHIIKQISPIYDFETDGRFYKIPAKDNTLITVDLGFNFIEKNELEKRLKTTTK